MVMSQILAISLSTSAVQSDGIDRFELDRWATDGGPEPDEDICRPMPDVTVVGVSELSTRCSWADCDQPLARA